MADRVLKCLYSLKQFLTNQIAWSEVNVNKNFDWNRMHVLRFLIYQFSNFCHFFCRLPFVEHIFYDNSYQPRSISHKFVKTLENLIKLGETVSDQQLKEAKDNVKPDFVLHNLQTSVSNLFMSGWLVFFWVWIELHY